MTERGERRATGGADAAPVEWAGPGSGQALAREEYLELRSRVRAMRAQLRAERRQRLHGAHDRQREAHAVRRRERHERHMEWRRERHEMRLARRYETRHRHRGSHEWWPLARLRTLRSSWRVLLRSAVIVPGAVFVTMAGVRPRTRPLAARVATRLASWHRHFVRAEFGVEIGERPVPVHPRWEDEAVQRDVHWLRRAPLRSVMGLMPILLVVSGAADMAMWHLGRGSTDLWWTHPVYALATLMFIRAGSRVMRRAYVEPTVRLLSPPENARLRQRVRQLTETRADAVDAQAAELRRIERDLHDGVQARLVAMGLNLGAAEHLMERDPEAAKALLAQSREASATALRELRGLVRGIHPPVLAERGLSDAVRALAMDCPLRAEVTEDLPGRAEAAVESALYFAVSELLTNAVKHAGAERVWIDLHHNGEALRVQVTDDGAGGADPAAPAGSGLCGVERRLGTFDGVLAVSSPRGGPTIVTLELPCALSSPRISTSSGKG